MSIFTARELWSTRVGQNGEEFDSRCVAVGNADNRKGASHCIVVGSLQGMLRIWRPEKRDFSPSDMLLEQDLGAPILQVSLGKFSRQFGPTCIGILHPRSFTVYELSNSLSAQGDNGSGIVQLHLLYTHQLQHVAHMFCSGPFGSRGAQDNDLVCVQSMDGLLSFFDDRAFLFARFLPLFLVPGPLVYVRDTDAFVTVNSSFELMAIKFQAIASSDGQTGSSTASDYAADMSASASSPGSAIEIGTTKRLQIDWSLQLGEMALDIQCAKQQQITTSAFDIIVLCEHHIFSVSPNGVIRTQKRLGYHPMCIKAYPVADLFTSHPISNLIVASAEGQLRVYSDSNVVWMARLPFVACSVLIAQVLDLAQLSKHLSLVFRCKNCLVCWLASPIRGKSVSCISAARCQCLCFPQKAGTWTTKQSSENRALSTSALRRQHRPRQLVTPRLMCLLLTAALRQCK
jgi:Bardet-Biedl syndrome 9 protein